MQYLFKIPINSEDENWAKFGSKSPFIHRSLIDLRSTKSSFSLATQLLMPANHFAFI